MSLFEQKEILVSQHLNQLQGPKWSSKDQNERLLETEGRGNKEVIVGRKVGWLLQSCFFWWGERMAGDYQADFLASADQAIPERLV